MSLEVEGHAITYWKALRCGKYETRGLNCGSTLSICQDVLKSDNLLHKLGFVDSLMHTIVKYSADPLQAVYGLRMVPYSHFFSNSAV